MLRVRIFSIEEQLHLNRMANDSVRGDRAKVIIYSSRGESPPQIAEKLGLNSKTVRKWIRLFNSHGVEGLRMIVRRGEKLEDKCYKKTDGYK